MNQLEWEEGNVPFSPRFEDTYYSRANGRAETDHVFIKGNRLDERWPSMNSCTIAELGFGTGLNFLETTRQWLTQCRDGATLNFISFEQYPLSVEQMKTAIAPWPELLGQAQALWHAWNPELDVFQYEHADSVRLTVYRGDANTILPQQDLKADAWYLDGFAPSKNPELWNADLLREVHTQTKPGGTFATYSSAGEVRRNLQATGFDVMKADGFGKKREMLVGNKEATKSF